MLCSWQGVRKTALLALSMAFFGRFLLAFGRTRTQAHFFFHLFFFFIFICDAPSSCSRLPARARRHTNAQRERF